LAYRQLQTKVVSASWLAVVISVQPGADLLAQQTVAGADSGGGLTQAPWVDGPNAGGESGHDAPPEDTLPSMKVPPEAGGHTPCWDEINVKAGTSFEHCALDGVVMLQHATRLIAQLEAQNSSPSHHSPGLMTPSPHVPGGRVVVVKVVVVVVEVVVIVELVVVVVVAQPAVVQASQQLGNTPPHPPAAAQRSAVVIEHRVVPERPGRQHATVPGRPQLERAAHRRTARAHPAGS